MARTTIGAIGTLVSFLATACPAMADRAELIIYPGPIHTEVGADWHALDRDDDGAGDTQNDGSPNHVLGTLPDGHLGRACWTFDLPDDLDPAGVVAATLNLRLKDIVGTMPANGSLFHSQSAVVGGNISTPTERMLVYHDSSFVDTGIDIVTPTSPIRQFYAYDVTSHIVQDLAGDGGDVLAVFRAQIDGVEQTSDLAPNNRYLFDTADTTDPGTRPYLRIELADVSCGIDITPADDVVRVVEQVGDVAAPVEYTVTNTGGVPVDVTLTGMPDWMSVNVSGSLSPLPVGTSVAVTFEFDTTDLDPGVYFEEVTFSDACDPANTFTRQITLRYLHEQQQPNIVIIFFDDVRAQEVNAWGESSIPSMVATPNIDTLAADGLRFESVFPGLPVCTPSRSTLMTGRMPFAVRSLSEDKGRWMVGNSRYMDPNEITFAEQLNTLGYDTGFVGKWHLDELPNLSAIPPERRQGWTWMTGYQSYGGLTDAKIFENDGTLVEEPDLWLPELELRYALQFIEDHQAGPFCLLLNHGPPHSASAPWYEEHVLEEVFVPHKMYLWDMYVDAPVQFRPNMTADPNGYPDPARQIREYHALLRGVDEHIAIVRNKLESLCLADNTVIVFMSDHGVQLGSFDSWEKNQPYAESIRCPLVVYDPRPGAATGVVPDLASLADLAPTIVELAGGTPHERMQGQSLVPLIEGDERYTARDAVMVQYATMRFEGTGYKRSRVLRTPDWKLVACEVGANTCNVQVKGLYDMANDPYELSNLANDPAYAAIETQLWDRLIDEMIAVEDPLLCMDYPYIEVNPWVMERAVMEGRDLQDETIAVQNVGTGTINYQITTSAPWLAASPTSGTSSGEADAVTLEYTTADLPLGRHTATVTVTDPNAANVSETIDLTLNVVAAGRVAIDLGGHDAADAGVDLEAGVMRPPTDPADGTTTPAIKDGRYCRTNATPGSDRYMYFRVDDAFANADSRPSLYVTVEYFDEGTAGLNLQYDSATGDYTSAGAVNRTNTGQWLAHTFHLTDVEFMGGQNGGSDFRIACESISTWIDLVEIGETPPPPAELSVSPAALDVVVPEGTNPSQLAIEVQNIGGGKIIYAVQSDAPWLSPDVAEATNIGELDSVGLTLSTAAFVPGDHMAHVTISADGVAGSPQTVLVTAKVRTATSLACDMDRDGDVDLDDLSTFVEHLAGPGLESEDANADVDGDGDVDLHDLAVFQKCIAGAGELPGC